jgi:hypothetical protein
MTGTGWVSYSGFTFENIETSGKNSLSGTVRGSSEKISADIRIKSTTGNITVKRR